MSTATMFEAMGSALGVISAASYPDTVTFRRPLTTKGSAGGNIVSATGNPTSPQDVPVRYRPASGREITLAGKPISGTAYMLKVPNSFEDALVDVDGTCLAIIAARPGGEQARTLQVQWIGRNMGLEVIILASFEE